MPSLAVVEAVQRLASRDSVRTEADLQADIYLLLVSGGLTLDASQIARLEVPTADGTRRRLDVEVGHTAIEIKKDLRNQRVLQDAEEQLAGYIKTRSSQLGMHYVGILTDGTEWHLYRHTGTDLTRVSTLSLSPASPNPERLLSWLEAILATRTSIQPNPQSIQQRFGASSPAHLLDHASLLALYNSSRLIPEIEVKRQLWAKLLRTAFGKNFKNDEQLFIDHTLLVLTAEIIAHAVVGFDISATGNLTPAALAQGIVFSGAQIYGVVEADFFDWVLHADGGDEFIRSLADRVSRFDWRHVEHDILKVLYEEVIPQEERANLGEYYTPDWLADRVVNSAVSDPLNQRVLDPACGSGTFLFHAIRAYLNASEDADIENGVAVAQLTNHVFGMDVHPVAVTLARVTYLLAIGSDRLSRPDRGPISVPVYLGDSIQWEQRQDLFGGGDSVRVTTTGDDLTGSGGGALFGDDLVFPRRVLHDAGSFDRLVEAMADRVLSNSTKKSSDLVAPILRQFGIHQSDVPTLTTTFDTMRRLHASGRNHIWGYYVRNLIRPLWLSEPSYQVDVLVGNPPWLRYSKMTAGMQIRYNDLSRDRGLLSGRLGISGRDLSTLFVARSVELYLKPEGSFAFVMPHGTLTRKPHEGFRSGRWGSGVDVRFDQSWDLTKAPTGFPMVSCVIRGRLSVNSPRSMPAEVVAWLSRARTPNMTWDVAKDTFATKTTKLSVLSGEDLPTASVYKGRFRQGAVLAPRALLFVEDAGTSPIGFGAGRVAVRARRSTLEKPPWKSVPTLQKTVERVFVRNIHLGETLLPFRMTAPLHAVLPIGKNRLFTSDEIDDHPGLSDWWSAAESLWNQNKVESDGSALLDRIDFHSQLSAQLPSAVQKVVYSKAGNAIAAARVDGPDVVIDHKLYWAAVSSAEEGAYLVAILNSKTVLERVRPLQARGLFGGRDIDKNVFAVNIPPYDHENPSHKSLVTLSFQAEEIAGRVNLSTTPNFKRARRIVRDALEQSQIGPQIEAIVERILPVV